jgi:hypothetical protein
MMDERGTLGNIGYVRVGDLYVADLPLFMRKGPTHPRFSEHRADFHSWCEENKDAKMIGADIMFLTREALMWYLMRWSDA